MEAYLGAVTDVVDGLIGQLDSLRNHAVREVGHIEGITLVGGGARLVGLTPKLSHYLTLPIDQIQTVPGFETATDQDIMSAALGLSAGAQMSLLPNPAKGSLAPKINEKRAAKLSATLATKKPALNPILIGLLLGVMIAGALYYYANTIRSQQVIPVSQPQTTNQTPITGYQPGPAGVDLANQAFKTILYQRSLAFVFVTRIDTLVRNAQIKNWTVTVSPDKVTFTGAVSDMTNYNLLIQDSLSAVPGFKKDQSSSTQTPHPGADGLIPFVLNFTPTTSATQANPPTTASTP